MGDFDYTLTVVTAVRNLIDAGRTDMIRRCIQSVARQKIEGGVEHVIADGASTDGTVALIKDILKETPRQDGCRVEVFSKRDRQVFEGMNNGLAHAHGKYIVFLNSDDYFIGTRKLAKAIRLFLEKDADVGYADTYKSRPGVRHWARQHSDINKLPFEDHFIHQSMVTKTSLMREMGGFDISLKGTCLENDLSMKILKAGKKFVRWPHCFCVYSLDGMTGRGTGQRGQHPDMFLKHFGADLGMTLEECIGLCYFSGLAKWSESECRQVLAKLERRPEWAAIWRRGIENIFRDGKRTKGSLLRRVRCILNDGGCVGLMKAVVRFSAKRIGIGHSGGEIK